MGIRFSILKKNKILVIFLAPTDTCERQSGKNIIVVKSANLVNETSGYACGYACGLRPAGATDLSGAPNFRSGAPSTFYLGLPGFRIWG